MKWACFASCITNSCQIIYLDRYHPPPICYSICHVYAYWWLQFIIQQSVLTAPIYPKRKVNIPSYLHCRWCTRNSCIYSDWLFGRDTVIGSLWIEWNRAYRALTGFKAIYSMYNNVSTWLDISVYVYGNSISFWWIIYLPSISSGFNQWNSANFVNARK